MFSNVSNKFIRKHINVMNVRNILILFVNTVDSNYVMSRLVYVVLTVLSFDFSFKRLFYCLKLITIFTELNL